MKIAFEQLFYGRGERGYGILGVSPGGRSFASRVEALCGAVGTPTSDYGGEPFLLSVPEGDRVVMACGRRGVPDAMGRSTLFFHVLVADKAELANAKTDAFSLFFQDVFADRVPTGGVEALRVDVKPDCAAARLPRIDATLPCVFRSEIPLQDTVCAAVGERANEFSWATFSFQALHGFDVQVLPPRVQGVWTAHELDASGQLIRRAAPVTATRTAGERWSNGRACKPQTQGSQVTHGPSPEKANALVTFSVVVNLVLVAICGVHLLSRKSTPASSGAHSPVRDDGKEELARIAGLLEIKTTGKSASDLASDIRDKLERRVAVPTAFDSATLERMAKDLGSGEGKMIREYQRFISDLQGKRVIVINPEQ